MEKVGYLTKLSGNKERLKILKACLLVKGSFDEAVTGVDGVFHIASPVIVPHDNNIQVTHFFISLLLLCIQICCDLLMFGVFYRLL